MDGPTAQSGPARPARAVASNEPGSSPVSKGHQRRPSASNTASIPSVELLEKQLVDALHSTIRLNVKLNNLPSCDVITVLVHLPYEQYESLSSRLYHIRAVAERAVSTDFAAYLRGRRVRAIFESDTWISHIVCTVLPPDHSDANPTSRESAEDGVTTATQPPRAATQIFCPATGARIRLSPDGVELGRAVFGAGHVEDSLVSRRHCRAWIDPASGIAYIGDLRSKNGTYLDGMKVDSAAVVAAGQRIRVGSTVWVAE